VGEPLGALVLAVAVTVIEVGLIVTLMVTSDSDTATLARDTVFAAVMITCNGVVGISLLVGALRQRFAAFNAEGTATALATVLTLTTLSLVLPTFTTSRPGPEFSPAQLAFAAVASLALYALFLVVQTVRHREHFAPEDEPLESDPHLDGPTEREALASLGLLVLSLIAVVGLAKVESPGIEDAIEAVGAPLSAVGVVIALLVLMPETLTAVRNARRDRVQASFNLALGSAMASIGLTIPTIAITSIWLEGPLVLGLESADGPLGDHRSCRSAHRPARPRHRAGRGRASGALRRLPVPRLQSVTADTGDRPVAGGSAHPMPETACHVAQRPIASSEMLVTPYFWVALSARSETKRYSAFSRQDSIRNPAPSIASR
jgi:Ca2+:H+ antiporter